MKKNIFLLVLSALLINLAALIINMVSDEAEIWCEQYLGENYLNILTIAFIVLLILSVFLANWKKLFKRKKQKAPADEKPIIRPIADLSSPTEPQKAPLFLASETFTLIEEAIGSNKLEKAIALMEASPVLHRQAINLKGRAAFIKDQKDLGRLKLEDENQLLNTLRGDMQSIIAPFQPLEKYAAEAAAEPPVSGKTYAYLLQGATDRRLACTHTLLGRDDALRKMLLSLNDPKLNAHQIIGPGGIGKTDFCKTLLQQYLEQHPQQTAYWIDIEYITDLDTFRSSLAQVLGLPETSAEQSILTAIEQSKALFYLDNLESLQEEEQLVGLLHQFQLRNGTRWLASSRVQLGPWEPFRIEELDVDNAVQVFINQWSKSSGELLQADHVGLKEFVEKELGRHPLSLILTASRGADFGTLEAVIKAWKSGSKEIAQKFAGRKDSKQDSLDASLELSLKSLDAFPNAKRLWALCAFFPNGMDVDALEYFIEKGIADAGDRALLIQRNILRNRKGQLSMLPPFAGFVFRQLREQGGGVSERQLFEDGLGFAMEHASLKSRKNERERAIWLKRLPFVFQFLNHFSDRADQYEEQLVLADRMLNYFDYNIFFGKKILQQLLASADFQKANKRLHPQFKFNLGKLEFTLGHYETAKSMYSIAYDLYKEIEHDLGKANCKRSLGDVEYSNGNYEAARTECTSSLELYIKAKNEIGIANCTSDLGYLAFREEKYDLARSKWEEAQKLHEKTGNNLGRANCKRNIGSIEMKCGNFERAIQLQMEALEIDRLEHHKHNEVISLMAIGKCYVQMGKAHEKTALQYMNEALQIAEDIGGTPLIKYVKATLAELPPQED